MKVHVEFEHAQHDTVHNSSSADQARLYLRLQTRIFNTHGSLLDKCWTFQSNTNIGAWQVTLVDCPGHASLIRTILCGARIIDMVLLVVDITKGGAFRKLICRCPTTPSNSIQFSRRGAQAPAYAILLYG